MKPWSRDKEGVLEIKVWIVECDSLSKEEQKKLIDAAPIKPSLIIESKNSYHIYYFAEDGTKENYEQVCTGLGDYYK